VCIVLFKRKWIKRFVDNNFYAIHALRHDGEFGERKKNGDAVQLQYLRNFISLALLPMTPGVPATTQFYDITLLFYALLVIHIFLSLIKKKEKTKKNKYFPGRPFYRRCLLLLLLLYSYIK